MTTCTSKTSQKSIGKHVDYFRLIPKKSIEGQITWSYLYSLCWTRSQGCIFGVVPFIKIDFLSGKYLFIVPRNVYLNFETLSEWKISLLFVLATTSVCPTSFECALNCRLGYRTDSNGCLLCECQSCPTMDQCNKNCPVGYLKDLFGCDTCECSDRCPPFTCDIICPPNVDYVQSDNGCPLCQCAIAKSNFTSSSCEV